MGGYVGRWRADTSTDSYQRGYDAGEAQGDAPYPDTSDANYYAGFDDGRLARDARAERARDRA